jgi:hypothetical protein
MILAHCGERGSSIRINSVFWTEDALVEVVGKDASLAGSGLLSWVSTILAEKGVGLVDSLDEEVVVLEDHLDLVDLQVDEHTGDLGGLVTLEGNNKLVDNGTDLVAVVWVLCGNTWEDWESGGQVLVLDTLLALLASELLTTHWLAGHNLLLSAHWLLVWHWHVHLLAHWSLHHVAVRHATLAVLALHATHMLLSLTLHAATIALLVALALEASTLLLLALWGTHLGELTTAGLPEVSWDLFQYAGEAKKELVLVDGLAPLVLSVLHSKLTEANLVLGLLVLNLTDLLDLVVVDVEGTALDLHAGELLLGGGSCIWLLVADEAIEVLWLAGLLAVLVLDILSFLGSVLGEELDALDITVGLEDLTEGLLSRVLWDVLDVQVASLFRVLVLHGLTLALERSV